MIPTLQLGGLGRARQQGAPLSDAPFVSVSRSTTLSTAAATMTAIPYDTEITDTDGFWASSPNPERLIIPTGLAGWYFGTFAHTIPDTNSTIETGSVLVRAGPSAGQYFRTYPLVNNYDETPRNIAALTYLAEAEYMQQDWRHRSSTSPISLLAGARAAMVRLSPDSLIGAHVYNSGSTACATASWVRLNFATEVRDDGGMYDPGTAYRLTVPSGGAGWYVMGGTFYLETGINGLRALLQVNGSVVARQSGAVASVDVPAMAVVAVRYLSDGQYIELFCDHNLGSTKNATDARLMAARVAAVTYGAALRRTTNQSLSGIDEAAISFDTEDRDDGGYFTSGSPTRITVPPGKGGRHIITGTGQFSGSTGGLRQLVIRKNGSTDLVKQEIYPFASHNDPHMCVADAAPLVAGDYLELVARDGGASVNFAGAYFAAVRVPG